MQRDSWVRDECQQLICTCHDDSAAPYYCTACGCYPAAFAENVTFQAMLKAERGYDDASR